MSIDQTIKCDECGESLSADDDLRVLCGSCAEQAGDTVAQLEEKIAELEAEIETLKNKEGAE